MNSDPLDQKISPTLSTCAVAPPLNLCSRLLPPSHCPLPIVSAYGKLICTSKHNSMGLTYRQPEMPTQSYAPLAPIHGSPAPSAPFSSAQVTYGPISSPHYAYSKSQHSWQGLIHPSLGPQFKDYLTGLGQTHTADLILRGCRTCEGPKLQWVRVGGPYNESYKPEHF